MIDAIPSHALVGLPVVDSGVLQVLAGIFFFSLLFFIGLSAVFWRRSSRWRVEAVRLRTTLDAAGAPVVVTNEALHVVDANAAATSMLNLRGRGLGRSRLLDRLSMDGDVDEDVVRSMLERDGKAVFNASVEEADGTRRSLRVRMHSGTIDGTTLRISVMEDVTTERALCAHYERFLDHLIENMPLEVAILSPEGKYRYLSSSFLVDDRQRSWFIGRTDFDYCRESGLHTELALRRRAHRMEAVDRCETVYFEERIVVDGRQRRLAWRYVPFEDEDGDVLMVLGFGQDRTELARCRDDLKEARENSARASRLKEALLQNVSHEIRTPLSGIIGTAQMLKSEMDPALREFMDSIEGNGRRLSDTLNNMIDLAGLQAERLDVKPMMLDSVTEVEDVVRACRSEAERRGLFLEFSAGDSEVFVLADREGLGRCVRSLVDNALKFTKDGGVAVDVSQRDDSAYIRVMDTGVGISRSVHHDVFEPFLQEEDGVDRSFEGAGMGLAVAEQFVRMMNGDLRVHSRKGAGASFVMRLPLAIPTLRRPSSSRPHVLVADPRQETHRLIDHLMEDQFAFEFVTELSDVDRFAEDHSFDVVLIDAKLGAGLTPDALLARIRAHPVAASARCVYLDGERRSGRRALCLDRGWDAYVAKPIQKLDLLNALYTTAEAREAAR